MDIFTFEVGAGEIELELFLTRYAAFGAGVGQSYTLGWSVNDQHGIYWQRGWYASVMNRRGYEITRSTVRDCGEYVDFYGQGFRKLDAEQMKKKKMEDPYAIGVKAGCYFSLNFQIHPEEFIDFLCGIICLDTKDDDKKAFHWVFNFL